MFGDLFNEESVGDPAAPVSSSLPQAPPNVRLECGLAGIENQGATCYLNSLLQTLLLTPEFREKLFSLTEEDLGCLEERGKPYAKVRVIPLELQRLFSQLLLSNQQSVSTAALTNSFGWTNQEAFQQHDVQELNRILFNAIEESLVGTAGQNFINELYHGTIVNQIICSKCKKISEREEDFQDLTLAVAGMSGLEDVLKQCYCDVENMDGNNQYRCETCNKYTDATKGAKLRNLPPILSISLLRFSFDFIKMTRYKENGRFTFPMEIDMSPYSEKAECEAESSIYELFSVVVHRGSAFGGHYFAYIRDIDDLGTWTTPVDNSSKPKVDPNATGLDIIECQSPVDLVENILGGVEHNSMSIDRLCAEISKVTGVSWNKRFRKTHGPLNKFLKSCNNFDYNSDSNWVSLSCGSTVKNGDSTEMSCDEVGDIEKDTKEKLPESAQKLGQNWFCFNDSRVAPIHSRDIEKQFSGKESAYMLFYRRKDLIRPISAHKSAPYKMPSKLIKEVEELNTSLDKQREEYDIAVNCISISVGWSEHFAYNCVLQVKQDIPESVAFSTIEIDRRKTFGQLKETVFENSKELNSLTFHHMKCKGGGYHLYEEFKDDSKTLQEAGLSPNSHIFVWDGCQVNDTNILIGEDKEPLQLAIRDSDSNQLTSILINKNKTLIDLYMVVSGALGQDSAAIQLSLIDSNHKTTELPRSTEQSLQDVGLKDADVVFVTISNHQDSNSNRTWEPSEKNTVGTVQNSEWSLTLLNRLVGNDAPYTCKTLNHRCRYTQSIKDLKRAVLMKFGVEDVVMESVRLREEHQTLGLQPPLREGLSISDAGLSNGVTLVLEHGRPPQDSEMTVSVNKVIGGKLVSRQEFVVDRQLTVFGMLQNACQNMGCDGSQWYLSKTDAYGDPADPLDDSGATLLDLLINDGDTLILQQGALIKKDQVYVNVWLSSTSDQREGSDNFINAEVGHTQGEVDAYKMLNDLVSKLSVPDNVPSKDLNSLNGSLFPNLEQLFDNAWVVQKAMGIEDLKQALMMTEKFQTLMIPTTGFMRLRQLEAGKLRAVLRNNSQLLRHANSKEPVNLAVQILKYEENLSVHEILLNVAQKIGGTRIYLPTREFTWQTSGGVGAADLKRVICQQLDLPAHDVLLAKYWPDSFTWTVLKDQPQKINKSKGKKKGGGHKSNIRQTPFYVQDGDIIGVKILSEDKGFLDPSDFSTQEDIEKRQLLQEIAEEKKRIREERKKLQADGFPSMRRPEATLTIKVDKFS